MASIAKYQPALDAREIKHFLDARAKGITAELRGAVLLRVPSSLLLADDIAGRIN